MNVNKWNSKLSLGTSLLGLALAVTACGEAKEAVELQGEYQTQAQTELSIRVGGVGCVVHEIEIRGFDMTIRQTAYDDAKCAGTALGVVTTNGNFSIGKDLAIAPGAREMDLTIEKVEVTPLHDSWASVFGIDTTGECQVSDVAVGSSKDVSGLNCGALGTYPAKDQIYFTSFNLVDETLHFTKLPSEVLGSVGTKENPAPRNQDISVTYLVK